MTKPAKPKDTPEAEYQRFLETARQVEAEETPEAFDRAFGKVVKPIKSPAPNRS